jgi:hypothetical protein
MVLRINSITTLTIKASSDTGAKLCLGKPAIGDARRRPRSGRGSRSGRLIGNAGHAAWTTIPSPRRVASFAAMTRTLQFISNAVRGLSSQKQLAPILRMGAGGARRAPIGRAMSRAAAYNVDGGWMGM